MKARQKEARRPSGGDGRAPIFGGHRPSLRPKRPAYGLAGLRYGAVILQKWER